MRLNGTASSVIPIDDRAVQYGDGCFTTMAVTQSDIEYWPQHLQRLQCGVKALQINFSHWNKLEQQVYQLAGLHPDSVIKIIISRGSGGRGYAPAQTQQPGYILSVHDKPDYYPQWQQQGIRLGLSAIKLGKQPLLAGIKHLNRLEQVMIKQQSDNHGFDDYLVLDTEQMMVETSAANIFWQQQGVWFTPELGQSGVSGVMRNLIIDKLQQNGDALQEVRAHYLCLKSASEVFICNSLMKVVPVSCFEQQQFACHNIRQIQQWFN